MGFFLLFYFTRKPYGIVTLNSISIHIHAYVLLLYVVDVDYTLFGRALHYGLSRSIRAYIITFIRNLLQAPRERR